METHPSELCRTRSECGSTDLESIVIDDGAVCEKRTTNCQRWPLPRRKRISGERNGRPGHCLC